MKWQRCTTSTPGHSISTMNAVICFFSLPLIILDGVRAITTSSSALVPFVHHSFSPFRIQTSSSRIAFVSIAAGSDPTLSSVSAKAEIAPAARRGKYFFFCASVPNSLSGWGTPMDWCAESNAVGVDRFAQEPLELVEKRLGAGDFVRILFGVGMDQIHPQVAEEELAHETGRRPLLLACGFGDFARFFSADFPLLGFGESSHAALM